MASLRKTTLDLARYRRKWDALYASNLAFHAKHGAAAGGKATHLREITNFGANPGALRMFAHVPESLVKRPPLVVVLHGCTQTAASYDHGTGWSSLADRHGFAVLFPEQQAVNNAKTCFSWFQTGDTTRGKGEAQSIARMIAHMVERYGIDTDRVFITGLSAGGAMTSVMLATYPELFAAGAIMAGLPYGTARTVQDAFDSMFNGRSRSAEEWGTLVRAASPYRGPWPKVSIWHGSEDATVKVGNADELAKQWANVHGLSEVATQSDQTSLRAHRTWKSPSGEAMVEQFIVEGMAHGVPIDSRADSPAAGVPGPFILDVGISSTLESAAAWGLIEAQPGRTDARKPSAPEPGAPGSPARNVAEIISRALRSAGLTGS
jgi:poly(hydroxyalkanoate) depolymerase family esterase